jgi:hypothetical protein
VVTCARTAQRAQFFCCYFNARCLAACLLVSQRISSKWCICQCILPLWGSQHRIDWTYDTRNEGVSKVNVCPQEAFVLWRHVSNITGMVARIPVILKAPSSNLGPESKATDWLQVDHRQSMRIGDKAVRVWRLLLASRYSCTRGRSLSDQMGHPSIVPNTSSSAQEKRI